MKDFILFVLVFLLVACLFGCGLKKTILYSYNEPLSIELEKSLKNFYIDSLMLNGSNNYKDVFALVESKEDKTIIVFGFTKNMSKSIVKLIRSSNRILKIGNRKIPVIFYYDSDFSILRQGKRQIGSFRGYLIEFNTFGEVLLKGPVY